MKKALFCAFLLCLLHVVAFASIAPSVPDASQLQLMVNRLSVVGGVLYVAAHPDDENTAMLAAMSQGRLVRAGYLSLTRGEGGQNLIGSDQGPYLGLIRTQELLAARSIDRAQQFFTRAIDFGYTKSSEETLRFWGHDNILSDVVWVIRKFRPDIILCRFPVDGTGHGQHIASAILAKEAFTAAADASKFPEQLKFVQPWQAKRILWNFYNWSGPPSEADKALLVPYEAGAYNPLLGLSYSEIAGISRSMHKSQGFGDSQDRGPSVNYFRLVAGEPAQSDLFDGVDTSWKRIAGSENLQKTLAELQKSFNPQDPETSIPTLLKAKEQMDALPSNPWVEEKKVELAEVIRACSGLWLEAIAAEETVVPGGTIKIVASALNRSKASLSLESVEIPSAAKVESPAADLPNNQPVSREFLLKIPETMQYSQQYWLAEPSDGRVGVVKDQREIGMPESPAPLQAKFTIRAGTQNLTYVIPVLHRRVDPVRGEVYRRLEIVPPVSVKLKEPVLVFSESVSKAVEVVLRACAPAISGTIHLKLPKGWVSQPAEIPFDLKEKGSAQNVTFQVSPNGSRESGPFIAEAIVGGKTYNRGIQVIDYSHIPPQTAFPVSEGKLVRLDLKKNGSNIAYIAGSGDGIPEALRQVGYKVTLLSDEDLTGSDLSAYDAVISGIRAYNTRGVLRNAQPRLMEYVKNGGTFVVQYNTTQDLILDQLGPYSFKLSRDRVSVEEAPVTISDPQHALLNEPNKITTDDFSGWVQERGLYFPGEWDPQYKTLFTSNDPGESPKSGALLYARYGKGVYIYTAYSWFRELPAGVPGAYRLFVNLISAK